MPHNFPDPMRPHEKPQPEHGQTGRTLRLLCAVLLVVACLGCEGAAVQLTVLLEAAPSATLNGLAELKVIVRDLSSGTPEIYGPFAIDQSKQQTLAASVVPDSDFYVDVWGCQAGAECLPADVVARGCSDVNRLNEADSPAVVTITLYDPLQNGAPQCPPPLPAVGD